ncbi:MAG TPA: redox-sensing transcriptional repressor Rex [Acidimicrobiia bacterium]|nr:redox-sensing transcriptional repressor Rex [Acidimicrobiia bacterium]
MRACPRNRKGSKGEAGSPRYRRHTMSGLSRATVSRMPRYLRLLDDIRESQSTVSSGELADAAGVNSANVRRDLSDLGFQGTRGVGYSVSDLRARIKKELGIDGRRSVAIIGAGNLGTALARYSGLGQRGFDVVAIYDTDKSRIGTKVSDVVVRDARLIHADLGEGLFDMAILAVPAGAAQAVADQLVKSGVSSILNFAPVRVTVPGEVPVRQVDLSTELQILSYYG